MVSEKYTLVLLSAQYRSAVATNKVDLVENRLMVYAKYVVLLLLFLLDISSCLTYINLYTMGI